MLTTGAFNALLKTLEEPPAHAIFILQQQNHIKFHPLLFRERNDLTLKQLAVTKL